jgi:hypothetical protein
MEKIILIILISLFMTSCSDEFIEALNSSSSSESSEYGGSSSSSQLGQFPSFNRLSTQ